MKTEILDSPPTSQELSDVAYTVPSDSEHQFLVEAIHDHHNNEVAKTQALEHKNIDKLHKLIEEQRKKGKNLAELNYLEVAVGRKEEEIRAETKWAIKKLELDRDGALIALTKWEESKL